MSNEMFSSLPDVMTAEQLASALQISKSGAYALLNRSDFPTLRIGGRKMVMKKDLQEWLNSRTMWISLSVRRRSICIWRN